MRKNVIKTILNIIEYKMNLYFTQSVLHCGVILMASSFFRSSSTRTGTSRVVPMRPAATALTCPPT